MPQMVSEQRGSEQGLVPFDEESRLRYRNQGWWTGKTLTEELVAATRAHASSVALITSETTLTYAELLQEAAGFAAGLADAASVVPGEAVMFQSGNVAETVVAYFGCLLAGARPVCTLPQHGVREIGLLAKHTGARILISQGDFGKGDALAKARQLVADSQISTLVVCRGETPPGALTYGELLTAGAAADLGTLPYNKVNPESIAVFQLSGGTTGLPKVSPRLHEEYAYNSTAWARAMAYRADTKVLYSLPLMHNAGISLALQPAMLSGATLILAPTAAIDQLLALVEKHRPDVLPLIPPALAIRLLDFPGARTADLSSIRDFVVGGQHLPVEVSERLRDELGIRVRQMFGMAEGMFLLTPSAASETVRHHTVGTPISAGDEVRILTAGGEDEVDDGQLGELATRGPYTIRGYYNADVHNRTAFTPDGFYRTGDLARRHRTLEGVHYSIEGRIKDVINRGVEKIHAEEVEELIVQHPAVSTAALVAMPDPVLGEKACAYLVLEEGAAALTVATLGAHLLSSGLARYKLPERVVIVSALPLTNVGKVAKVDLRTDIQRRLARESQEDQ